ncbi:copper resistance protein NlpE N-terminal domain-containing protein [Porphyromonadaceae bacterium W3.11]|nr:copper resistance protein NlpE N-terminal domain-containing protein [Porphyromonadaceae bacterium W3.11]
MKKVFYLAVATIFALSFASCKSDKSQKNEEGSVETTLEEAANNVSEAISDLSDEAKAKFEELGEGFFGTYVATLPGADNAGFETTLEINSDLTYNWSQNVVGVEDVATDEGKVTDINSDLVLTLVSNNGETQLYKVIDGNKLLMLNEDGSEPAAETREFYIFTRK